MSSKRVIWVDYVKVFACILVVLGHFFQSMVKDRIILEGNFYIWFKITIYYFHVPLFFICSGYLYQKYSKVDSWKSWGQNISKKFITLGIPYFVFTFVTWGLKSLFASTSYSEIGGLFDTLFVNPIPPYWFLYILFIIFFMTPTMRSPNNILI